MGSPCRCRVSPAPRVQPPQRGHVEGLTTKDRAVLLPTCRATAPGSEQRVTGLEDVKSVQHGVSRQRRRSRDAQHADAVRLYDECHRNGVEGGSTGQRRRRAPQSVKMRSAGVQIAARDATLA